MGDHQEQRVYPVLQMEANNKKTSPPAHEKTQHLPTQRPLPLLATVDNTKTSPPAREKTQQLPAQRPLLLLAEAAGKTKTLLARGKTEELPIQRPLPPRVGPEPISTGPALLPPPLMVRNKKQNLCCKFICWGLSLLITALIALAIAITVIYFSFHPKLPQYEVNSLRVSNLGINLDLSLSASFKVKITARNPNRKIGIYYEKGGRIQVWYTKTKLCEGPIPKFYQGHRNVTRLNVDLTGRVQFGNTVLSALQQQQQTGRVPLDLKVDAPVAVKLGKLKLKKIRILGNCKLVVDSLSTNNVINIKASDCKFGLKL